jgi:hypothetical protein
MFHKRRKQGVFYDSAAVLVLEPVWIPVKEAADGVD